MACYHCVGQHVYGTFPSLQKVLLDRLGSGLKTFSEWGEPLKNLYGNPYLSLISAQVTPYTVTLLTVSLLLPQLSTKTDDRPNQKCLVWNNLKYQITRTRGKKIGKH